MNARRKDGGGSFTDAKAVSGNGGRLSPARGVNGKSPMTILTAFYIGGSIPVTLWRTAMFCDTAMIVAAMIAVTIQICAKR